MKSESRQLELPVPSTWGGRREGAGRKRGRRGRESHRRRPDLSHRHPVHATWRVLPHVWNLRSQRAFRAVARAFRGSRGKAGFRLVHFSVQGNHLHLVVEAGDKEQLARGMAGLGAWIARRLNRMMGRRGRVFADRFHAHVLRGPREVKNAVAYVLGNFAKHACRWAACAHRAEAPPRAVLRLGLPAPDPYSSAGPDGPALTEAPRTWLLLEGLRRVRCLTGRDLPGTGQGAWPPHSLAAR